MVFSLVKTEMPFACSISFAQFEWVLLFVFVLNTQLSSYLSIPGLKLGWHVAKYTWYMGQPRCWFIQKQCSLSKRPAACYLKKRLVPWSQPLLCCQPNSLASLWVGLSIWHVWKKSVSDSSPPLHVFPPSTEHLENHGHEFPVHILWRQGAKGGSCGSFSRPPGVNRARRGKHSKPCRLFVLNKLFVPIALGILS